MEVLRTRLINHPLLLLPLVNEGLDQVDDLVLPGLLLSKRLLVALKFIFVHIQSVPSVFNLLLEISLVD